MEQYGKVALNTVATKWFNVLAVQTLCMYDVAVLIFRKQM
jgi:hypothetical protein